MNWLNHLQETQPVAHGVIVLFAVAALGLALGNLKYRGLGLGVAGTLFIGLYFGHFGVNLDPDIRGFIQELGLILFVYTIGMQVGPGFFSSLRKQGLPLNIAAASIVVLGAVLTVLLCSIFKIDLAVGVGILSGATTNTPSLGAAQDALRSIPGLDSGETGLPGLGYAVAYPFGIIGIILAMLAVRYFFKLNIATELNSFRETQRSGHQSMARLNLVVENPNLDGLPLAEVPGLQNSGVVVSRIKHSATNEVTLANKETVLRRGDVLVAVGEEKPLENFRVIVGRITDEDIRQTSAHIAYQRVVVTRPEVVGKSLRRLALNQRLGVSVTRITRADIEMGATADLPLQFGDMLRIVGSKEALTRAAAELGNSVNELNQTKLVPMFVGIVLGVIAGGIAFKLGNMPAPIRLGLAGGPLVVAILLSRLGKLGPLLFYLPANANVLLRELGIVLFLSCVGLKSGEHFVETLRQGGGLLWMGCGAVITLVPLMIVGFICRAWLKMNYMNLCGLLAGSMTDPPALAFANNVCAADAPSVAYASVYPLTMLLRILLAQLLVILFMR